MKLVIYKTENGISILTPSEACGFSIDVIAKKDVPKGLPYVIVDASVVPVDRTFRSAWEADFTNPDGYGEQV